MELHQKRLLEKRSFFLLPNNLKIQLQNSSGELENYISYESLKGEVKISSRKNPQLLFLSVAMSACAACILVQSLLLNRGLAYSIFPLIIAVLSGILYQYKQQNYSIVETGDRRKIIFLRDRPNRRALEQFLAQLWTYRKQYLREKYFYINVNSDRDLKQQTRRLRWLLEQGAIAKAEYKLAKEDWIIVRTGLP